MRECQACARNIVTYLSNVKVIIEEEKLRRLSETGEVTTKKESKKKKKRNAEKESKTSGGKIESQTQNTGNSRNNDDNNARLAELSSNVCARKSDKATGTGLCRSLTCLVLWFFVISSLLTLALMSLSWRYEKQTDTFLQNAQSLSGLPLKHYHKHITDYLQYVTKITTVQVKSLVDVVNGFYETQFQSNTNAEKEM
ncbi:hypothetical protein X777_09844 [Ooceraea biroi]|uniref:Uncharacterized protein n=2 Tax=Ooceraea biroi TaxID=2015173 RepID=A0A026W606_OOCBI|nr:hypothetical protein X777_09844 [Ooceraea biroi]